MNMKHLETLQDLQDALAASTEKPVVLFKHSTRCPVSHAANKVYLDFIYEHDDDEALFTYLDLINHRDISNAMAKELGVPHESPQAIVVKDGKPVWNASHFNIKAEALAEAIKQ